MKKGLLEGPEPCRKGPQPVPRGARGRDAALGEPRRDALNGMSPGKQHKTGMSCPADLINE